MDDSLHATSVEASGSDALHHQLHGGRPEFGSELDGLRARMRAAVGGLAPRTIGRYRLGSVIGSGSFGAVYEAEDPELDRRVAIKLLRVRSTKEVARVVREAQLLATLSHPNVVQVFEVGTTDDGRSPYVVMELVEGTTLRKWMSEGVHGWREAVEAMLAVAQGLWAAHQAGIIHRDLKPENVLIGRDGRPRVIDFGLARALGGNDEASDASTLRSGANVSGVRSGSGSSSGSGSGSGSAPQLTATGQVMGTPAYMAPEVFTGEHTPKSDQYALCLTLYEVLFGCRPFVAESPAELAAQLHAREARLPADRRGVPRRVAAIALKGLRKSPRARFGDLGELVGGLVASLEPQRRGWLVGAAALGVGGLLVGGFAVARIGGDEVVVPDEEAVEEQEPSIEPELAAEVETVRTLVATSSIDAALERSAALLERAEALGHGPTLATAELLRGQAMTLATDYEHAIPMVEAAYLHAQEEGSPIVAAHAASELVGLRGYYSDQYETAHQWKDHAEGAFERAGLDPLQHVPYVLAVSGLRSRERDNEEAMTMLRIAIAEVESDHRAETSEHAALLRALGRELYATQQHEDALEPTRRAAEIYAASDGYSSYTHAAALANLGLCLVLLGRFEEALPYTREALELREEVLEPGHMDVARSHGNMGMVLGKLGRYEEAFVHLGRAIELFSARKPMPSNSAVGEAYALRAAVHAKRGPEGREAAILDYDRAARMYDDAGVIYVQKAEGYRQAIRDLGGTPPPTPSIPIPP